MFSILRKIPFPNLIIKSPIIAAVVPLPSLSLLMDSISSCSSSPRLLALAQQLRLYKPPPPAGVDPEDIEPNTNKVISQVGFAESSAPIWSIQTEERNNEEWFKPKTAAVLICLFEGDSGDLRVILTKRSSKLSTHSGEVALPGGKVEEGDKDEAETSTREAWEEIGLDPSLVNVVTILEPFLSKHLLRVVPVIGILSNKDAFKPVLNEEEVEAIFDAPLEMFIKDENRRVEEREWMGYKYLIHYFDYEADNNTYLIWGLTAGILIRAASVVYQRAPPFVEQNPRMKVACIGSFLNPASALVGRCSILLVPDDLMGGTSIPVEVLCLMRMLSLIVSYVRP